MKIEVLELATEFEDWIAKNPNSSEEFIPFALEHEEEKIIRLDKALVVLDYRSVLDLLVVSKGHQALIQFLWMFCDNSSFTWSLLPDSAYEERAALDEMYVESNLVLQYENYYRKFSPMRHYED